MRKMLKASSLLICAMLLFSACASSLNLRPGPFRSEMQDVFVQQTTLTVPASHAEQIGRASCRERVSSPV